MKHVSKPVRITRFQSPTRRVENSSWGKVTYLEWCNREAKRIVSNGRPATVEKNERGQIAVFVC